VDSEVSRRRALRPPAAASARILNRGLQCPFSLPDARTWRATTGNNNAETGYRLRVDRLHSAHATAEEVHSAHAKAAQVDRDRGRRAVGRRLHSRPLPLLLMRIPGGRLGAGLLYCSSSCSTSHASQDSRHNELLVGAVLLTYELLDACKRDLCLLIGLCSCLVEWWKPNKSFSAMEAQMKAGPPSTCGRRRQRRRTRRTQCGRQRQPCCPQTNDEDEDGLAGMGVARSHGGGERLELRDRRKEIS
jgi:hypothetical protein